MFSFQYFVIPRESVQKVLRCWRNESVPKYKEMKIELRINTKEPSESVV